MSLEGAGLVLGAGSVGFLILSCRWCPALLVVGDTSPAVDVVVECNSRLNPTKTTLLKMADCGGLPQVVQPGKLAEAFKYFVQGMSYMPTVGMTRLVRSRTHSASSVGSTDGVRSRSSTTALPERHPIGRATSPTLTAAGRTLQMWHRNTLLCAVATEAALLQMNLNRQLAAAPEGAHTCLCPRGSVPKV
ncbi:hypothetical protein PFLUV_G00064850 [Perca fluviatilis]|uniref:Protein NDRG1 n=1 Tax=Perca fluviatilis TaxID=8168 RepID=A0A6A5ENY3_PERFL|nr:hypothetical protein PFLUV_G00064850 [Perca fluviatilis]